VWRTHASAIVQNSRVRWHYRDPLLVWLLVASYAAHIVEEWLGGFPEWLALIAGKPLPRDAFIVINAVGLAAMIAATRAATRRESLGWLATAVAALLFVNGLLHLLGSSVTGTYSPGLFTGVILYLPLGQLALLRAWHQAPGHDFGRGVAAGVVAHVFVSLLAFGLAGGL
jgi:Protein of unknown function with HXXEE motif